METIYEMIERAREDGKLTDDRPSCAREVDKAGNLGIHAPEKFEQKYPSEKAGEILLNTRKVLEELYR